MTDKTRPPAYFAVARTIFDHPLFMHGKRPYSRREAWEWLIAEAAWKPKGHRHVFGVADLKRGQLSASLHDMAAAWHWPVTNCHRFLHRLEAESMVTLAHAPIGAQSGKGPGKGHRTSRHVITICNYDKFQSIGRRSEKVEEKVPDNDRLYLPGIIDETTTQQNIPLESKDNQQEAFNGSLRPVDKQDRPKLWRDSRYPKPNHGSSNGKFVWYDYKTADWNLYAADYLEVRGASILPENRPEGMGNWFCRLGEQTRKASGAKRAWREAR